MASKIHITTARKLLDEGKPLDLTIWTKSGKIERWRNCVGLRSSRYSGTRQIKLLESRQIRTVRDVCIYRINDMEVYL